MIMTLTLPCRVWAQKEQELAELRELAEERAKLAELRRQEAEKTKAAVEKQKASYEKLVLMHQLEVAKMDQLHQECCNLTPDGVYNAGRRPTVGQQLTPTVG